MGLQWPQGSRNGTGLIYEVEQWGWETEGGQGGLEVEWLDSCEVVGRACDVEHLN